MNIVAVTEQYLPTRTPVVASIAAAKRELETRGHRVQVITPHLPGIHRADPNIVEVPAIPFPGSNKTHLSLPGLGSVDSIIAKADLVHLHQPFALARWALDVTQTNHIPSVYTHHEQTDTTRSLGVANGVGAVITPWAHSHAHLQDYGVHTTLHHVPHAIPLSPAHSSSGRGVFGSERKQRLSLDPAIPVLLFVGPLDPTSRVDNLITWLGGLEEPLQLIIAGEGPERVKLEALTHRFAAGQHVHFVGGAHGWEHPPKADEREHADLFALADLVVTASDDQFPYWILEAAAAGIPAVAVRNAGTEAVIAHHQSGFLTPPTKAGFVRAIRHLLYRPALRHRFAAAARTKAADYSIEKSVNRLLDVYSLVRRTHSIY